MAFSFYRERGRAGASKVSSGRWEEVDRGEWRGTGGSDTWARLKKGRGRRGVWWFSSETIGWGGRAPWTASWTESNNANVELDRVLHWPGRPDLASPARRPARYIFLDDFLYFQFPARFKNA
jgi:hypothetical protein